MRRRRWWVTLFISLLWIAVSLACAAWPGRSTFTVSPETTYVTGPLDKSGYVDYVAALNERLGKGITAETNATVLIWRALGPSPEGGTMPAEYFQWLGIECPPEEGEYWISWENYLQAHAKNDDNSKCRATSETLSRAVEWPWTANDEPELADWLKQNAKPLALTVEATRQPAYFNPLVPERTEEWSPGLIGSYLPTVQQCRKLASALVCQAMLRIAEGKVDEAWQDLLACHRLGRLVSRGGTMIELLVGLAVEQVASKGDLVFLDRAKLTSKQVLACWQDLERLPPIATLAEKVDLGERFVFLDIIMLAARQGMAFLESVPGNGTMPPNADQSRARWFTRSINWDPALTNMNRRFDRLAAVYRIPNRETRLQEMGALGQEKIALKDQVQSLGWIEKSLMGERSRGETIGNVMIALMVITYDKVNGAEERCGQNQRNLHLAFALAAYQRDQRRYPAKLDELVPKYLKEVPGDLFSGKPLIYRPEEKGFLLYSVGLDGTDDDGRGYDDDPRGDDLSIRMPVPQPRANSERTGQK
jgi:hypothetical protein